MKAISGDLPVGEGWGFEIKWDGMRILTHVDSVFEGGLRLTSANKIDATARFPEMHQIASLFGGKTAVLDGEMVALDQDGRPSFSVLQRRMHVSEPHEVARRAATVPVAYQVFDLLHLDGHDLTGLPFVDRRRFLEDVLEPGPAWRITTLHDDGEALLALARQQELEGIVAKRLDSIYKPGARSPVWRKIKIRRQQEFVVGGWSSGTGKRANTVGSLLVGFYDGESLRYAGRVGTGFNSAELSRLQGKLAPLVTDVDPFDPSVPRPDAADATFVRPELVVECAFAEWSTDGRLRHPAYLGERLDRDPRSVTSDD